MIQEPISTEETWLQGIPVSPGIALGKIKIQISGSKEPVAYEISPEEVDAELVRFHQALFQRIVRTLCLRGKGFLHSTQFLPLPVPANLNGLYRQILRKMYIVFHPIVDFF